MRRTACLFLAAASLIGATRPHYGGTLRMRVRSASFTPRTDLTATDLSTAVFDTLVVLDDSGHPQPALAASWTHDSEFKRWEFRLRSGVRFHDGTPLTADQAAAALDTLGATSQGA